MLEGNDQVKIEMEDGNGDSNVELETGDLDEGDDNLSATE